MRATTLLTALLAVLPAACSGDEPPLPPAQPPAPERAERPVQPPDGWRTVVNRPAGFSLAAPPRWRDRERKRASVLLSPDRLLVVTVSVDRRPAGLRRPLGSYVTEAFKALPGLEGSRPGPPRPVRVEGGQAQRVDGAGKPGKARRSLRVTVMALRRRGATYTLLALRHQLVGSRELDPILREIAASVRAEAPS